MNWIKDGPSGNWGEYLDRIGLFFFFVACAGLSIVVWVFNWVCWLNQCCCCDFLHNPVNKRIAWWMSFTFLLGMMACCIAAFVSVNRFGFALEGAWCSLDRLYYDSIYGQLKDSYPRWEGFDNIKNILNYLDVFGGKIESFNITKSSVRDGGKEGNSDETEGKAKVEEGEEENEYINFEKNQNIYTLKYSKIYNSFEDLKKIIKDKQEPNYLKKNITEVRNSYFSDTKISEFDTLKTSFLEDCYYYGNVLKICMKILSMIYFCFFLIAITFACVSLMFYACLKKQGYLIIFMHVLWNIIRFFMFSFFIFGGAYGMFYLALKDSVAVVNKIFIPPFLLSRGKDLLPKEGFLEICLKKENFNFANELDPSMRELLEDFFKDLYELNQTMYSSDAQNDPKKPEYFEDMKTYVSSLCDSTNLNCENLPTIAGKEGGLFGSFNCGFLNKYLHMVYTTLYEASIESRKLCALSLSSSFFGAISVYFFLLVMHHYNNERFFDNGKSIFTGFDGFGLGYKKANLQQDPAYKKRRFRAEIELTSKNDEANGFRDVNKNESEE